MATTIKAKSIMQGRMASAVESNEFDISTRSLTNHMIRERSANVWDYYKEIRRIGEGSIGYISLVKRRRGTEGGSAYTGSERKLKSGNVVSLGCRGVFGCLIPKSMRRRKPIEKPSTARPLSCHTEEYALKSIQLRLVERKYLDELRNEINVLRSLDHPNIVKAYEVYENKANICEYIYCCLIHKV